MKVFTDYPIKELGDISGKTAPIREVELISYDGNMYCTISVEGVTLEVKSGYLYREKGRSQEVPSLRHNDLIKMGLPKTEY